MSQSGSGINNNGPGGYIQTLTGNVGGAVSPNSGNINVVGSGAITVTGNPGSSTLTISLSGGGFTWNLVSTPTIMSPENGYVSNHPTVAVVLTLPPVIAFGEEIEIAGYGAAGWSIVQNAGQIIHYGKNNTTLTTGTLNSTNQYDQVSLLCVVANSVFIVRGSIGNLSYT